MNLSKLDNPITRGLLTGFILMSPIFTLFSGATMIGPYLKNRKEALLILFIGLALVSYLVSPFIGLFYLIFIFIPFFVFLEISKKNTIVTSFPVTLFKVIGLFASIFTIIFLFYLVYIGGVSELKQMINEGLTAFSVVDIETLLKNTDLTKTQFIDLAITNSLASVLGFLFVFLVLNGIFASKFISTYAYFFSKLNYSRYKLGDIFYILGFLAIAVFVLLDYLNLKNVSILSFGINIIGTAFVKIIFLIFAFYGVMVWHTVTNTFFKSPVWQRLFFIISIISIGYFIALIGFFDMWINFRKLIKRRKEQ